MLPSEPHIIFFRLPKTADRNLIGEFLWELSRQVAGDRTFTCLITSDAELQQLNRTWRRKDRATDVLSFPTLQNGTPEGGYLGDIAISWQRARAQAAEFGHSLETEIRVLMLHGVLHLLGMDHETDGGRMSRAETRWRRKFGLPHGLIERAGRRVTA